jgi:hypothetical protein
MEILTVLLKISLGLLNLPVFYWLIKKLTIYTISMDEKAILDENGKFKEKRYIFQNQQDFNIPEKIDIEVKSTKGNWRKKLLSIVHGPNHKMSYDPSLVSLKSENPKEENVKIIFPYGVRSYATWLMICRTLNKNDTSINGVYVEGENILSVKRDTQNKSFFFSKKTRQTLRIIFSVSFLFFVGTYIISNVHAKDFFTHLIEDTFFIFSLVIGLVISIVYSLIISNICTPVKPNIIMGYLDETDPISTSHWEKKDDEYIQVI